VDGYSVSLYVHKSLYPTTVVLSRMFGLHLAYVPRGCCVQKEWQYTCVWTYISEDFCDVDNMIRIYSGE